jgi:hypothetical protein
MRPTLFESREPTALAASLGLQQPQEQFTEWCERAGLGGVGVLLPKTFHRGHESAKFAVVLCQSWFDACH